MDEIKESFSLWKQSGRGDHKQLLIEQIWRMYHPKLQYYVRQMGCPSADTPDRASEILLKAFESLERYNPRYSFSTWIYTLARNHIIDGYRKKNVHALPLEDHEPHDDTTPEDLEMSRSERQMIKESLSVLKDRDREIIFLHYYEEMKYREIASVTSIPLGTVKYRISEAKKILKKELERRFQ